jgi:DNA repair protein RadC
MKRHNKIWSSGTGPREKLIEFGASSLSDCELLAIFLHTGVQGMNVMALAESLVEHFGSIYEILRADYASIVGLHGMGAAKYAQLSAVTELTQRRYAGQLACENVLLNPAITRQYLQNMLSHREREVFLVLFLDNQHRVIRHEEMFAGTISSVEIHPREIVREAMKVNATALILAHNHPSGKAEPSFADRRVTEQIIKRANCWTFAYSITSWLGGVKRSLLPSAVGFRRIF